METPMEEYQDTLPGEILGEYTLCETEYDCNSTAVQKALNEIENSCEYTSLEGWVNCTVRYINQKIRYDRNGGVAQCGDKASEILVSGKGNCVDFSTLFVALCRGRGIPAYMGGLTLTRTGAVGCDLYQVIRPMEYTRLLGIKPRGHAIALVYFDGKWTMVDPTFEYGLTRKCYGYSPILVDGKHEAVCRLPYYKALPYL